MSDTSLSTAGIVGSDGRVPIYNPESRFQVFKLSELFMGPGSPGRERYVPNIDDLVIDMDLDGLQYKVVSVDPATLIPTLREMKPPKSSGDMSDEDLLLGPGPGTQSDTYRVYLDKSVMPYTLAVDARLSVAGTMASYCRIFRGADLTNAGNIISLLYDSSGTVISNRVPLEMVGLIDDTNGQGQSNISIKTVPVCYTTQDVPNGEVVTAVFYSDAGNVISKRQLLLEHTSFIRSSALGTKHITHISLECPFLSQSNPNLIELPINVLLTGLNLFGVVHYSDGSRRRMPVDGTKFSMLGLERFIATVVDQSVDLVLTYRLSNDEASYNASAGEFRFVRQNYRIKVMQQSGAYNVKLYCYPVWMNEVDGYDLRWFLYTGNRDVTYDVTNYIEYATNSPVFNPIRYGINQQLNVAVNLQRVNGSYRNYRHAQIISVVLYGPGTDRDTNWTIAFDPSQNPPFGEDNYANLEFINYNLYKLKLDVGAADIQEWLERLYYRTRPLIDQFKEQVPPAPTHFRLRFGTQDLIYPISQWNTEFTVANGLENNKTLFVEFIKRTPDTDLLLSIAGMPIYDNVIPDPCGQTQGLGNDPIGPITP
jgi:hypothetical protein